MLGTGIIGIISKRERTQVSVSDHCFNIKMQKNI